LVILGAGKETHTGSGAEMAGEAVRIHMESSPVHLHWRHQWFYMEHSLAILIVDLSGFTAMTEVHGAKSAAALIERFMQMVQQSLVGDSRLHERTGDQVMIVGSRAEDLAFTATFLLEKAYAEENFLNLHAGLHFGEVAEIDNAYYGSAVNTAARIVAATPAGKIMCSAEFLHQLTDNHSFVLEFKGAHQFRNLRQPVELYEMFCCISFISKKFVIDPVCHMLIRDKSTAVSLEHNGERYYFCSEKCRQIFSDGL
jgi:adenylate cyclase